MILEKVHRVIEFKLKQYININTKLRNKAKNNFEKDFFTLDFENDLLKLMNNAIFGKTMENVRKHRDNKLVTTDERRNQLASEPNYHTTKYFSENSMTIGICEK